MDGGLVSPVPVRFARQMGAELVLAVDISSPPEGQATGLFSKAMTAPEERLDRFMARAVSAYYAARDPFGRGGDFTTAPEISLETLREGTRVLSSDEFEGRAPGTPARPAGSSRRGP